HCFLSFSPQPYITLHRALNRRRGRARDARPMRFLTRQIICLMVLVAPAHAETIRLSIQKTGTVAWELAIIRAHGLDKAAGLDIATMELASPEAGKIALRAGSADIIVSDWLWVSRERTLGAKLVFYPYSSAIGAVMVPAASPITSLAGLK